MTTFAVGDDGLRRLNQLLAREGPPPPSWIAGSVDQILERLRAYADAGVDGVYLQHLVHEDLDTVEIVGRELAPAFA
jgi:alkanesulfonate monooxygenase SsuD/methylene tetrahydromethanopterin reductase-like flavin-dependent oxidoreductase (luciferase family)